jgi:iron(III) transport system substrate-binding protein
MRRRGFLSGSLVLGLAAPNLLAACAPTTAPATPAATEGELTLYSARKEDLMQPVVDRFTQATGVKVTMKSGAPGELALLIEQEKASPRGDVLFTTDAGTAESAREKGLFEAYESPGARAIPAEFKAADGTWTGVVGRSRNLIANRDLVKEADLPTSVFALTDARWRGKVTLASIREAGVRLWLASLVTQRGDDEAMRYIKALLDNGARVLANHTEVTKAVGRGEFAIGLVNHYYYTFEQRAGAPLTLIYPDQGSNEIGTLVTPLAVAILKGARHPRAARAFVDFTLTPAGQEPLMAQEAEISLVPGVPLGNAGVPGIKTIDQIRRTPVTVAQLAAVQEKVVRTFTPLLGGA